MVQMEDQDVPKPEELGAAGRRRTFPRRQCWGRTGDQ